MALTFKHVLIILTIIILVVGIVLGGLHLYWTQAYKSNLKSLSMDVNRYVSQIFVYWKTPIGGGGAGMDINNLSIKGLAQFLNFSHIVDKDGILGYYSMITENGEIRISGIENHIISLQSIGKIKINGYYPQIWTNVNLYTFVVTNNPGRALGFGVNVTETKDAAY